MKRGLTALVTFALVGGLMFMGFAGTAAAQEDGLIDIGADVDNDQTSASSVTIENTQQNNNAQTQAASSESSSDKSYATTVAEQSQEVNQVNSNSVSDVTSVSMNTANTDASTGISLDISLGDDDNGGAAGV